MLTVTKCISGRSTPTEGTFITGNEKTETLEEGMNREGTQMSTVSRTGERMVTTTTTTTTTKVTCLVIFLELGSGGDTYLVNVFLNP